MHTHHFRSWAIFRNLGQSGHPTTSIGSRPIRSILDHFDPNHAHSAQLVAKNLSLRSEPPRKTLRCKHGLVPHFVALALTSALELISGVASRHARESWGISFRNGRSGRALCFGCGSLAHCSRLHRFEASDQKQALPSGPLHGLLPHLPPCATPRRSMTFRRKLLRGRGFEGCRAGRAGRAETLDVCSSLPRQQRVAPLLGQIRSTNCTSRDRRSGLRETPGRLPPERPPPAAQKRRPSQSPPHHRPSPRLEHRICCGCSNDPPL